jgi:hypothetical protein
MVSPVEFKFLHLFELCKVRTLGLFRAASNCVCAGEVYSYLTSAVSGSAIADGVNAGLLKNVFFGVLFKRKINPANKHACFAGPICVWLRTAYSDPPPLQD